MEHEPILQMKYDRMLLRYAYKPLTVMFHDKSEWQNEFNTDNIWGLVWYTDGSKTNNCTSAGVYKWGLRRGHSFSLGLHTMVFQAETHAIKARVKENKENSYAGTNIYIISNSQAATNALDSFQINSKLVSGYHHYLVKLTEHNRIQLGWVLGHMEIDGN
jgi:hypothetical protein